MHGVTFCRFSARDRVFVFAVVEVCLGEDTTATPVSAPEFEISQANALQTDSFAAATCTFKALRFAILHPEEGIAALLPRCANCRDDISGVRFYCDKCCRDL